MLSTAIKYLTAKLNAVSLVDAVYGLGEVKTIDGEKLPVIYEKGDLIHVDFDTKKSLSFFLLDGRISRETEESTMISGVYNVKETIPLKLILYVQGSEDINCESLSQDIAWSISKTFTGRQLAFSTEVLLDYAGIEIKEIDLDGEAVWNSLYSTETRLKDNDILLSVSLSFNMEGREECFVADPCDNAEVNFDIYAPSFCDRVNECVADITETEIEFLTTGASTYLFNGTVTGFNPDGKDLRGKRIKYLDVDGIRWSSLNSDYSLNSTTGLLTFNKDSISDVSCYITALPL